jgi:tetratricopeptide (TPR) repeat protein
MRAICQGIGVAGGVNGFVRDAGSHDPVVGARVDLMSPNGFAAPSAYTNENGEFHFFARDGDYQITVAKIGYQKTQLSVSVVAGHSTQIDIDLSRADSNSDSSSNEEKTPAGTVSAHELSAPSAARDDYSKGKESMAKKDFGGAIASFQKATREFPDFYEAYAQMGVAQYMAGHADEARASLRKSIDLSKSKYPTAIFDLADVYNDVGDYARAEPLARQVVALDPSSWRGYFESARALLGLKRYPEAEQSARKSIDLAPKNQQAYIIRTNIHIGMRDYPAALKDIDAYLKLDPSSSTSDAMRSTRAQVAKAISGAAKNSKPPKSAQKPQ